MNVTSYWPLLFRNRRRGQPPAPSRRQFVFAEGERVTRAARRPTFPFQALETVLLAFLSVIAPTYAIAQPASDLPVDIIVALDNSGSMKQNDPERVMRAAVSTFAAQLPENARLGIVVFDKNATAALPLSSVSAADFAENTKHALQLVDYRGKWTDISGAVERALYELREHGRPASRRVVVLFTDGFVDLGDSAKDRARTDWLRNDLVTEARRESVMIFGIAFTEAADFELLQSVSQQTGGSHFRILSASEIPGVFKHVNDQIQQLRAGQVPHTEPGLSSGRQLQAHGNSEVGASIPLGWVVLGLAVLLIGALLWLWWARVSAPPIPATLQDSAQRAKIYTLDKRVFRVGRVRHKGLRRNDLVIPGKHVSRAHAEIFYRAGQFYIRDDNSLHGTFLNGVRLKPKQIKRLGNEDVLRFDAYEFLFGAIAAVTVGGASVLTETAPDPGQQNSSDLLIPRPHSAIDETQRERIGSLAASPRQSEGRSRDAESLVPSEECLGCDKLVPSAHMRPVHGFKICPDCEAKVNSLHSGQAQSFLRKLETKRRRRLQTIDNL